MAQSEKTRPDRLEWLRKIGALPFEDLRVRSEQPSPPSTWQDMETKGTPPMQMPVMQIKGRAPDDISATSYPGMPEGWHPPMAAPKTPTPVQMPVMQIKGRAPADMPYDGGVERLPQFDAITLPGNAPGDIRALSAPTGATQKLDTAPLAAALTGEQPPADMPPEDGVPVEPGTPGAVPVPETPEESAMIKMFMARRDAAIADEKAFQGGTNAEISRLRSDNPLNLRPLAALTDTWTGSRLLPGFDRPRNNGAAIAALQAAIQKSKGNITDSETELLKSRMMAEDTAARDDKKYVSQADMAGALQDALNARQQSLFEQQTGLQTAKFGQQTALQGRDLASREKRANAIGGALNAQKQENRIEDKATAADKLEVDRAIVLPTTQPYKQHEISNLSYNVLDKYIKAVEAATPWERVHPGTKRDDITQAYGEYLIAQKTSDNLGVLAGPDVGILKQELPDASAYGYNTTHFGDASSSLDIARKKQAALGRSMDRYVKTLRATYPGDRTNNVIKIREDAGFEFRPRPTYDLAPPYPGDFKTLTPEQRTANKAYFKANGGE